MRLLVIIRGATLLLVLYGQFPCQRPMRWLLLDEPLAPSLFRARPKENRERWLVSNMGAIILISIKFGLCLTIKENSDFVPDRRAIIYQRSLAHPAIHTTHYRSTAATIWCTFAGHDWRIS